MDDNYLAEFGNIIARKAPKRRKLSGGTDWVDPTKRKGQWEYPYSYSSFYHWREKAQEGAEVVYGDRLMEWDYDKYTKAMKPFKKPLWNFSKAEMTKFLTSYIGHKVKAVALAQGCNVSNGNHLAIIWYIDSKKVDK